jgi:hypothetical protein
MNFCAGFNKESMKPGVGFFPAFLVSLFNTPAPAQPLKKF